MKKKYKAHLFENQKKQDKFQAHLSFEISVSYYVLKKKERDQIKKYLLLIKTNKKRRKG